MKSHYLWLFSKHIDVPKLKRRGIPRDRHWIQPHCQPSSAIGLVAFFYLTLGKWGERVLNTSGQICHCALTRPPPAFRLSQTHKVAKEATGLGRPLQPVRSGSCVCQEARIEPTMPCGCASALATALETWHCSLRFILNSQVTVYIQGGQ